MSQEGYSEDEVKQILRSGQDSQLAKMNKAISRMRHYNGGKKNN
jgi:hypothetical protein